MRNRLLSKFSISFFITVYLLGYAAGSSAHGGGATMDAAGISRTFTAVVLVTCFDDGNGPAENLIARVRDNSPQVPGLLVNMQLFKGNKAVSITDTVSGDADYSPFVTLHGGPGVYFMIVNKTDAGARSVDVEWHCSTVDGIHTGTEISVSQFN
ncbi:hypothetical protein SAMN05421690_10576 [Nitrosomonas sp. Nm51]|uniref:hypothetical protein n=1 Tax=Nitrosomonas sp. Nm51 TaxID=133720 RepID=UPI0008B66587|nr:hypothetical protein [Nitrosomonas sp. Nm51]SER70873.1 hypothetical protein SAMN05421690_10576 [Nitrosomonas sp. Nm51]